MRQAKLKAVLENLYQGYCLSIDAKEMWNTEIEFVGKITTVAKIARKENFTAEETVAFVISVEVLDVDEAIAVSKNHEYRLFHDAHDDYTLRRIVVLTTYRRKRSLDVSYLQLHEF